jgi:isopenicillin-N epimerase
LLAALSATITPRTKLAVLDHITSSSALLLPIGEMIAACHALGVPVLVDGAHAPGQVALDLTALNADWYVGNCHKWLLELAREIRTVR